MSEFSEIPHEAMEAKELTDDDRTVILRFLDKMITKINVIFKGPYDVSAAVNRFHTDWLGEMKTMEGMGLSSKGEEAWKDMKVQLSGAYEAFEKSIYKNREFGMEQVSQSLGDLVAQLERSKEPLNRRK